MFIDTHAHYEDESFDEDRAAVLEKVRSSGCIKVVDCAQDIETSLKILEMTREYDFIYAAVGIHPEEALKYDIYSINKIKDLARSNKKVVAIGETGLDYYHEFAPRDVQKENFRANIQIARELDLPVIVHDRDAHEDTLKILEEEKVPAGKAVFHCFSGSLEMAKIVATHGWYFSFGGAVTFKNAKKFVDILKFIPDDLIMLETDSPYMAPEPVRGTRNDSSNIKHIIAKIAEIKGCSEDMLEERTNANAKRFFGLND